MNLLLIYPDIGTFPIELQQGIGHLSSILKGHGHKTSLLHVQKKITIDGLLREVMRYKPDIIGFSTTTNQYPHVENYSKWIKEHLDIPIICGGMHPTLTPEEVISNKNVDIICRGEGEYALLELLEALERGGSYTDIRNLWVKHDNVVNRNPLRPLIEDLDVIPFADREIFDYKRILKNIPPPWTHAAEFITGRGCPFNCTYCCNHSLRELYRDKGTYARLRSVENVLQEIKHVTNRYKVKKILFHDDTFTLNPGWLNDFCKQYSEEVDLPFICNAHPNTLNDKLFSLLADSGCEEIRIGIESGNEWLRNQILSRPITNDQIIRVFKWAKEEGIKTYSFNMIGLPYETPEMIEDTIKINSLIDPDFIQVSIFYPFPGTKLYDICMKEGFLTKSRKDSYFSDGSVLNLPTIGKSQIDQYYHKINSMAFDKTVRSNHPSIYPFYCATKMLLGEKRTYRITRKISNMLYGF